MRTAPPGPRLWSPDAPPVSPTGPLPPDAVPTEPPASALSVDELCPWCQGRGLEARPAVSADGRRLAVVCRRCGYTPTRMAVGALPLWGD